MKITLDLEKLRQEGKITQAEYEKLSSLGAEATGSLAFNILISFGVIAVSVASIALVPSAKTAIFIGLLVLSLGIPLIQDHIFQLLGTKRIPEKWKMVSNICILVGSLLMSGGIVVFFKQSILSFFIAALVFAITGIGLQNQLFIALSVLTLSVCLGAETGYSHASYYFGISRSTLTILLFSALAGIMYVASHYLPWKVRPLALVAARTAAFLVNLGFWVGSLWGDKIGEIQIPRLFFAIAWALILLCTGIWAAKNNKRWILNTAAVFGAIHFYTQWFDRAGASAFTILLAGLFAIGFALFLRYLNISKSEQ